MPIFQGDIENVAGRGIRTRKEFDNFFRLYYTTFLSFACRYGLGVEASRDIVQDVFVSFWKQRENFHHLLAVKTFFYRSIAHACLDALKHEDIKVRYAENYLLHSENEEFTMNNIIQEEVSLMVRQKVKKLTPREQEVISLTLQGKSLQEIADILSLSVATVKSHKMHAYSRLRTELEELRFLLFYCLFI